jgi:hypothetical protein
MVVAVGRERNERGSYPQGMPQRISPTRRTWTLGEKKRIKMKPVIKVRAISMVRR